jgi:hypothetical protein
MGALVLAGLISLGLLALVVFAMSLLGASQS